MAEHPTVNGVPLKKAPTPLKRQPSNAPFVSQFDHMRLPLGMSYPKFKFTACGRLITFLVKLSSTHCAWAKMMVFDQV